MPVEFDEETLRLVSANERVLRAWPGANGTNEAVERLIRGAFVALAQSPLLRVEFSWDDGDCVVMNYKYVWCFASDGRGILRNDSSTREEIGLLVTASLLLPIAVWAQGFRSRGPSGTSASGHDGLSGVYVPPSGGWGDVIGEVERVLRESGLSLPAKDDLLKSLVDGVRRFPTCPEEETLFAALHWWND